MKYTITADISKWPKAKANNIMAVVNSAACIGSIKIEFSYNGKNIVDERDYTEIPMFLTEFEDFLTRVNSEDSQY